MNSKQFVCKSPWYILLAGKEGREVLIHDGMIEVYSLRLFRFKKLVHTFPVNDVVQIRTIENLVLADTFIALTKSLLLFASPSPAGGLWNEELFSDATLIRRLNK